MPAKEYNLQRGYTFWYMRRGRGQKAAESTGDPSTDASTAGKDAPTPYESSVKQIATVRTVGEFWDIYNHLTRPNDIPNNMTPLDYHFFLEGVKPTWEDEGNAKGGKWIVRLRKGLASRYWEEVILALIGGQLPGVADGDVCGAVISMRYSEDIVSVWNRRADDRDSTERLRDAIKKVLRLPSNVHMEYKPHQASLMDKSSFRNTTVWKSSKMDRSRSLGERDSDRGSRMTSLRNRNNSWGEREGNLPAPSPKSRDSSDRWR
mmetsp:Transcript_29193/g.45364  ORF Transcript_29193/g.45364 Transcript_29193/m.45364 type:complete len:262 (-) Transcript_29193:51-836(-)